MLCSISNRVPTDPVVARTTGCFFERSLVEKYIDEHGRCPVTGEPLARADLIAIRPSPASPAAAGGVASAGLAAASLPSLLDRVRAEWDGVMLEQFTLRQQAAQQQQELAHALQQYEAACRVVARLTKECEALRRAAPEMAAATATVDRLTPMPAALAARMDEAAAEQQALRKTRKSKEAAVEKLNVHTEGLVMAEGGAVCLAAHEGSLFAGGLRSHEVVQYGLQEKKVVATGLGHSKPIHSITVSGDGAHVITAAEDSTVRVWKPSTTSSSSSSSTSSSSAWLLCEHTLRYASGVSALSRRTIGGQYIFSGSRTGTLYLSDITRGEHVVVSEIRAEDEDGAEVERNAKRRRTAASRAPQHAVTAVELHPYTNLAAVGTQDGKLLIWNVKEEAVDTAIVLPTGKGAAAAAGAHVRSLDFSLDCVTLAAGFSNGHALVWDLRKIEQPLAALAPASKGSDPATVRFDVVSGGALAVGCGAGVRVWRVADLGGSEGGADKHIGLALEGSAAAVSGLAWGAPAASSLAAISIDGVVKVFGE